MGKHLELSNYKQLPTNQQNLLLDDHNLIQDQDQTMSKVIVIAGTAGTGKSTIGEALASKYHTKFIEGDELHAQVNIDKMSNGIPLTDEDRWSWLESTSKISARESKENELHGVAVVSCSSLKKVYRDYIRSKSPDVRFIFVFLYCELEELMKRTEARKGHYMKSNMIQSQFDILELPKDDEDGSIVLDVTNADVDEVFGDAVEFVERV